MNEPKTAYTCESFTSFIYSTGDGEGLEQALKHLDACNHCRMNYEAYKQQLVRSWELVNRHARRILTEQMDIHRNHCTMCRAFCNSKDTALANRFFAGVVERVIAWVAVCEGSDDVPYFDDGIIVYIKECEDIAHRFIKLRQIN